MDALTLTIDGTEYQFGRLGMGMMLRAEERLQQIRRETARRNLKDNANLPDAAVRYYVAYWCEALRAVVPITEVAQWLITPSGMAFSFWQSLLVHQPDLTEEESHRLMDAVGFDQFQDFENWVAEQLNQASFALAE